MKEYQGLHFCVQWELHWSETKEVIWSFDPGGIYIIFMKSRSRGQFLGFSRLIGPIGNAKNTALKVSIDQNYVNLTITDVSFFNKPNIQNQ